MQTETQVQPEMPLPGQSIESNEQKSKRGGKRPGAGRKKNPVTILLKGTSRTTLLQALENVDPELVAAKITKLLQSKREIIWLQTLNFIYDRMLGKPKQDVSVSGAKVPDYWPRAYGMDVGWNKTAAIFGAHDRDSDVAYLTSEHYRGMAEPIIHAEGIKARGSWIPGYIDPAANGRSQIDGKQLFGIYAALGLKLKFAENAREAGIYAVWMRLSTGKLKIFRSCKNWFDEFRIFCRDENGNIINENKFHLMASTRYLFLGSMNRWIVKPVPKAEPRPPEVGIWG